MTLSDKKRDEKIQLLNCYKPENGAFWNDDTHNLKVEVNFKKRNDPQGNEKKSYMRVKWYLPKSINSVKTIKIREFWQINNISHGESFEMIYPMKTVNSNSKTINNIPSVLKSEISNEVKVTKDSDDIVVSGTKLGENIKVYTSTGLEIKNSSNK